LDFGQQMSQDEAMAIARSIGTPGVSSNGSAS